MQDWLQSIDIVEMYGYSIKVWGDNMAFNGFEIVEKSNSLNELRLNGMTLQQLRFFSIYLAKINARNIDTRKVIFKLEEF